MAGNNKQNQIQILNIGKVKIHHQQVHYLNIHYFLHIEFLVQVYVHGKVIDLKVYQDHLNEFKKFDNYTFARQSEIFGNDYKLISRNIEVNDIIQGNLEDCYFLTAFGNLTKYTGPIFKNIFKNQQVNKNVCHELVLRINGIPRILINDAYISVYKTNKKTFFAKPI